VGGSPPTIVPHDKCRLVGNELPTLRNCARHGRLERECPDPYRSQISRHSSEVLHPILQLASAQLGVCPLVVCDECGMQGPKHRFHCLRVLSSGNTCLCQDLRMGCKPVQSCIRYSCPCVISLLWFRNNQSGRHGNVFGSTVSLIGTRLDRHPIPLCRAERSKCGAEKAASLSEPAGRVCEVARPGLAEGGKPEGPRQRGVLLCLAFLHKQESRSPAGARPGQRSSQFTASGTIRQTNRRNAPTHPYG